MSPPGLTATPDPGVSTKGRRALTSSQLKLVEKAARASLEDGVVSAAKVNRLVRRFGKCLNRCHLTFTEFVRLEPQRQRAALVDPDLHRVIAYLDRTGETAVNRVLRSRGF